MDGKYVNGVDIVDFDDDGLITQFKVMGASFASGQYAVAANGRAIRAHPPDDCRQWRDCVSEPLVEAKHLNVRRQGGLVLNVSLTLGERDFITLIGPNGAGKSVLLRHF